MKLLLNDEVGQQKLLEKLADEVTAYMLPEVDDEDAGKTVVVSEEGKWEVGEAGGGGSTAFEFEAYYDEAGATSFGAWKAYSTSEVTFDELREAWGNKIPIRTVLLESAESTTAFAELEICSYKPGGNGTENFGVVWPKGNELLFGHFEDWDTKIILGLYKPE